MLALPKLSLADSRPLDALFGLFVIAIVASVVFLVWRYGRHARKTLLGRALAVAITSLFPAALVRFIIALTGNGAPSVIVWLVWLESVLAFSAIGFVFLAPDRIYHLGERSSQDS